MGVSNSPCLPEFCFYAAPGSSPTVRTAVTGLCTAQAFLTKTRESSVSLPFRETLAPRGSGNTMVRDCTPPACRHVASGPRPALAWVVARASLQLQSVSFCVCACVPLQSTHSQGDLWKGWLAPRQSLQPVTVCPHRA